MKTLGNFLRFARLLIFANIGIVASIATAAPLRIMPLGDSITVGQYGVPTEGGYRTRLYELLSAQGIDVDFIGTQSDSINNTVLADRDHEGHGGYTIEDVRSGIASWLSQIANPDVVLLHIGTNDFWMGRTLEETRTSLSNLLGDIATLRPNARILVAKLIVRADAYGAIQEQFGREYLPGIIQEQVALGRRVSMVDLYPALDPILHLLPDQVHPNLAGYVKMADGWFPAIQQLINPVQAPGPSLVVNGSFEAGAAVSASANPAIPFDHFDLDNWTVAGNPAGFGQVAGVGATDGVRMAIFNGAIDTYGGTVSQTFATVAGESYQLQFDTGVVGGAGDNQLLGVAVTGNGGASLLAEDVPVATTTGATTWVATSRSFTANGTATTLTFTDKSGTLAAGAATESDMLLDHVRVTNNGPANTAPIADNESYATTEGVELVIASPGVLVGDTDGESDPLTAALVVGPSHGALALNADGSFTYTPVSGYVGTDSFTYKANDGALDSNVATVSITVNSAGPSLLVNGSFEAGAAVSSSANPAIPFDHFDLDNWTVAGNPAGFGQVAGVGATDGVRMAIFNGATNTYGGTVSQTFATVAGATYQLQFDTGVVGGAGDNQLLGVAVTGNGGASLLAEDVPAATTTGATTWVATSRSFTANGTTTTLTFTDKSGTLTAGAAMDSDMLLDRVRVVQTSIPNTPPVADEQSVELEQNEVTAITLTGSDLDGDSLTFAVAANPAHGSVSLAGAVATYTPNPAYSGTDSFTFTVNDGMVNSAAATVAITINPAVPSLLVNGSFELGAAESSTPASPFNHYQLDSWVVTGNPVGFQQALPSVQATHGVRMAIFNGATDTYGGTVSQTFATVPGQTYQLKFDAGLVAAGASRQQLLGVTLAEGFLLSEDVLLTATAGGSTQWTARKYWFTAAGNTTTLAFTDKSGMLASGTASGCDLLLDRVRVEVNSVPNTAPVANAQSVDANEDTPELITLTGSDADGDNSLAFALVDLPTHGTLSGTAPNLSYTPSADYSGPDSFTFTVNDGTATSTTATVSITIHPVNDAPVANEQSVAVDEDDTVEITLAGSDLEGGSLTFAVADPPDHGSVSITGAVATYTPSADYSGPDNFSFTANDGTATSVAALVSVTVNPINDAPVAAAQSLVMTAGTSLPVLLSGNDVDANPLTFTIASAPSHGAITGTVPNLVYTPVRDYVGPDSFTFTANDGQSDSVPATISITVEKVLKNGSFEQVTGLAPTFWTASGNYVIQPAGSFYPATDGTKLAIFSAGAHPPNVVLSQTFATEPGQPYVLQFDLGIVGSVGSGTQTMRTTITGTTVPFIQTETLTPSGNAVWTPKTYPYFIAGGTSATLTFQDISTSSPDRDMLLDNVRITPLITRTLAVNSTPINGVSVTVSPADLTSAGNGTTGLTRSYLNGAAVNLTVPSVIGTANFQKWLKNGTEHSTNASTSIIMDANHELTAVYNYAPISVADNHATAEDNALEVASPGVLGNDSDPEANPLTATLVATTTHGNLVLNPDGSFTYSPAANYHGNDEFTYRAADAFGQSTITTVSITVNPVNDIPVANGQSLSMNEDGTLNITLTGSDVEGTSLTYTVGGASNGALSGTAPDLIYTPNANFNGSDSFTFTVNDGTVDSAAATVSITVNPVNDIPVANAQSLSENEDGTLNITLTGSDVEGTSLTYTVGGVANGTLSGTAPDLIYTPNANFNGSDSFTFTVNDGAADSAAATVSITINPVNDIPVANAQSLSVNEDGTLNITLTGSDVEGTSLTYSVGGASNGTLSGTAPDLIYTPNANFNGSDSFTFTVNDGAADSAAATVSITINPVNDIPVANAQSLSVNEDGTLNITLTGSDVEGTSLTYTVGGASNGTLSGTAPDLIYTPNANFNGSDSFTFTLNDGTEDSAAATVSITVNQVNDIPVANAQSLSVNEDGTLNITLTGSDVDGSSLTYSVGGATNGTLSGTAPDLIYTPNANFNGSDSFTFTVNDGTVESAAASVSITVNPVNDIPVANAQSVSMNEDGTLNITLTGSDVEGTSLTYTVGVVANGTLSGTAPDLIYTPNANFNGSDSFTITVNDGTVDSAAATVSITVNPINDAPVANAQSLSMNEDGTLNITLTGSDVEGTSLTYTVGVVANSVLHGTTNGVLSGTAPNLIYTPNVNFNGSDSFTFTVNDGTEDSAAATVSITVNPVNDIPVANVQSVSVDENSLVAITLTGNDVEGTPLSFAIATPPTHGSLSGTAPNLTYTPSLNFSGADSFEFTVSDGTATSAPATVSITVNDVIPTFTQWMAGFGLGSGPNADNDKDSISNAVEFVIGGNPANQSNTNLLPTVAFVTADPDGNSVSSNYVLFTYRRTDLAKNDPLTTIKAEWNDDFTGPWINAAGAPGVIILEDNDGFSPGVDRVRVYLPRTLTPNGSFFVRLNVVVNVAAVNESPVAQNQSVNVNEDGSVLITLAATDADGDSLTYTMATPPAHGALTGSGNTRTYTPDANYHGPDSFTFSANDGSATSTPATVSITVNSQEEYHQWLAGFGLNTGPGTDSDGDSISNGIEYIIGGNPANENNASLLPTISLVNADPDNNSVNADYLRFTYRRTDLAKNDPSTTIKVEWNADLIGLWTNAGDTAGVVVLEQNDAAGVGVDLVNVYIPRSLAPSGKLFARLVSVVATP